MEADGETCPQPQVVHLQGPEAAGGVCREELFAEMMAEREDIAAKRAACQVALRALREAQATIETLPQVRCCPVHLEDCM